MPTFSIVTADLIAMNGNAFGWHFAITVGQLVAWTLAIAVGLVAETLIGRKVPFGFVGAVLAALLGIWLLTEVIHLAIPHDPVVYGVPIMTSLLGAISMVLLWNALAYRASRPRHKTA